MLMTALGGLGHDATIRIQQLNFVFGLRTDLEGDEQQKGYKESKHCSRHVDTSHLLVIFHRLEGLFGKIVQDISLARLARAINIDVWVTVRSSLYGWIV